MPLYMVSKLRIVIALGGNALGSDPITQLNNAKLTAKMILPIIRDGHEVIITHGNGPQVGLINLAFQEGGKINSKVYNMPFSECNAMSEGYIAYHLKESIQNEINKENLGKSVSSLVTTVLVDKSDPAFLNPTKPIGSFYKAEEIKDLPYTFKEDSGRGYRRVIASPKPIKILEEEEIKTLSSSGFIVICCGGGGIPVITNNNNEIEGIDAVIDKDYVSSLLASEVNADCLLILTAVKNAKINFNKPNEEDLFKVKTSKIKEYLKNGEFGEGSMKPKIEASLNFLNNKKDGIAIITDIESAYDALNMKSGTIMEN